MARRDVSSRRVVRATNGSNAYQLNYVGDTVAAPAPQTRPVAQPRTRTRAVPRVQERTRVKVRVREQQAIAPFAVCGFMAVVAVAIVLLLGYVRLNTVYAETVQLQHQLTQLQSEGANLEAQYEETFDRETLERAVAIDGTLINPTAEQSVYIDLSEPDNAVVYGGGGQSGLARTVGEFLALAVEFFR
ncbi:MAG: hypothetical protein IJ751_08460 [Oscillospiraceae bacterium]|nr:hypothetical protein [Oscillospiraceae bacterium]